ncbi:MAG: F0F1 ATP synthase subunit A [Terracidiphilus sp.]|jgi:F-type H+-transporting ATPase subunit a
MPETSLLVRLLNSLFLGIESQAFQWIDPDAANATHSALKVNQAFALELLVVLAFIAFFILVRVSLSAEKPGAAQQFAEIIHEQIGGLAEGCIGHGYQRFQAFVTCIFLFVLTCNLAGLIPGLEAPTMSPFVPLGLAVTVFIYYNFHGVREQGPIGYLKHFCGPMWQIAPLLFLIEIISHVARLLSLTVRLWANMYAGDLVTLVFFSLFPLGVTLPFLGLHILVSVVQALVFCLLAMIYLGQAVAHEH